MVEQVDLTLETDAPTEPEADTSGAAKTSLPTANLSAEQKTLQQHFDEQIAAEKKAKAKKKAPIKKTTPK